MEKLKFNPNNKNYYSEEFIKGFECGVERQFNADMEEKTAEWIVEEDIHCSKCGGQIAYFVPNPNDAIVLILDNKYCPNCGAKMKGIEE